MPDYQPSNNNHNELDPAVKDSVDRLRKISENLQKGNSGDIEAIGRGVADIGFLVANIVESQPPTGRKCYENRQNILNHVEKQIADVNRKTSGRGVNLPTALTIISIVAAITGVILKALE